MGRLLDRVVCLDHAIKTGAWQARWCPLTTYDHGAGLTTRLKFNEFCFRLNQIILLF